MAQAPHDQNFVKTWLGVWCVDGTTTIPIAIDPISGAMMTDSVSTISYVPTNIGPRDQNFHAVLMAEDENGRALPVNVNADGEVLVDM